MGDLHDGRREPLSQPSPVTENPSALSLSARCGVSPQKGCAGDLCARQGEAFPNVSNRLLTRRRFQANQIVIRNINLRRAADLYSATIWVRGGRQYK